MNYRQTITLKQYFSIAISILLMCLLLFSLDRETHSFADLITPGNLVALLIYFIPTYIISLLFYTFYVKKYNRRKSMVLAIVSGALVGFFLVISLFLLFRP